MKLMELQQLLIPKLNIYKHKDGYVVYIPERFTEYLPKQAKLTILLDNEKIPIGVVTLFKANSKKYAIKLPKRLGYLWDDLISKDKQVTLVLEKLTQGV